jgi:hypothetical protein
MKKIAAILSGLFFVLFVHAQEGHYHEDEHEDNVSETENQAPKRLYSNDKVKYVQQTNSWIASGILGTEQPAGLDTTMNDFIITNPAEKKTIALEFLGNLGSPGRSKIFFDRKRKSGFLFFEPYEIYYTSPEEVQYFNTKLPYTNLSYTSGSPSEGSEHRLNGVFAVNINPRFNVGMYGDWINAYGAYASQSTKHHNAGFFGSYMGKHHNLMANFSFNGFENYENGGFINDSTVTDPGETGNQEAPNMPVFFVNNAFSKLWNWNARLNYKYHIGIERDRQVTEDSVAKTFVPVTSFIYNIQLENSRKRYSERSINMDFYRDHKLDTFLYINNSFTMDSTRFSRIKQAAGISLNQEFNTLMNFGLTGYVVLDIKNYTYFNGWNSDPVVRNTILNNLDAAFDLQPYLDSRPQPVLTHEEDNLRKMGFLINPGYQSERRYKAGAGVTLAKYLGENLTYNFNGEYYFIDEKETASSFLVGGNVQTKFRIWKQEVNLGVQAEYVKEAPDFLEENYFSNHIQWVNGFKHKNTLTAKGVLAFPSFTFYPPLGLSVSAGIKGLKNYIYWNKTAMPEQHNEDIELVEFTLKEQFKLFWFLHLDNEITYQKSTDERIIPLPEWCLYSNLYFQFDKLFKVLTIQVGANIRWNTEYYAPDYLPATGVFYLQDKEKAGNYPYINAYINCQLKSARFFVQYIHLNQTMSGNNYLVLPGYALDPSYFKLGVSVYLKN